MERSLGNLIADSMDRSLGYAEGLLQGVTSETFARFATPGGVTVESNHPAFVYGHLSLYGPQILKDLDYDSPAIPERFVEVFSKDAKCVDDPTGDVYPSMEEVTEFFFEGYKAASVALREVPDGVFAVVNPRGEAAAKKFPTMGSMHTFYGSGHMMIHLGQMSAWRRMQGLGSLG